MPLDPNLAGLLTAMAEAPPMFETTPDVARQLFRGLTADARPEDSRPTVGSIETTEVAGAAGPLAARVYRPETEGPVPTIVMFHGGGWVIGDLDTHDAMARAICAGTDAVIVSVDYRLAPEHAFPAAAQDAIAAAADVQQRLSEFGGSDVIAVAGDSAGGNLSAVVTQNVAGIAAQFLIYPATDAGADNASRTENAEGYFLDMGTMLWFIGHYLGDGTDLTDPLLSPHHGALEGLPPALVVTVEFDPLRDEGIAYGEALAAAGVRVEQVTYPGLIHGFFDMGPWSPACQTAVDDAIGRFATLLRNL